MHRVVRRIQVLEQSPPEAKHTAKDSKNKSEQTAGEGSDLDERKESPMHKSQAP